MVENTTKTPKVFISYAWSSEEHQERIENLATRLRNDGIDALLDSWDLEPGQDKFKYMEKCVSDSSVDKVLIICDKNYQEKADDRLGGVGTETMIISQKVYAEAEQTKFIPIIFEKDENGEAFTPIYINSRIYFDMSEDADFEDEYIQLVRFIYEKPLKTRPPLGEKPAFLEDTNTNLHELRSIIKKFEKSQSTSTSKIFAKQFLDSYIRIIKTIHPEELKITTENAIEAVNKLKPVRDMYIEFLEKCAQAEILTADLIVELLSKTYNEICKVKAHQVSPEHFSDIRFLLWEMLLCSVVTLYEYNLFEQIYMLACSTIYVRPLYFESNDIQEHSITFFKDGIYVIGHAYREQDESRKDLSNPLADFLASREKQPLITKKMLGFSDVLLWYVTKIAKIQNNALDVWLASMKSYDTKSRSEWVQLSSAKFCSKILPLFGANNIEELKNVLQTSDNLINQSYDSYGADRKITPLEVISLDKIATRN